MKKITKKAAKIKAIRACNNYIRQRDLIENYGICFTCLKPLTEAGHLFPAGSYESIRFDERNINGQCTACNCFKHGNLHEYIKIFIAKYGKDAYDDLDKKKNILIKRNVNDYLEIESYYKQKLEELK